MSRLVMCAATVMLGLVVAVPDTYGRGPRGGGAGRHSAARGWHGHWQSGPTTYWYAPIGAPAGVPAAAAEEETATLQTTHYLRLKNETDEKITVNLFYRAWTNKNRYRWYPTEPSSAAEPLSVELEPGAESELYHEGWQIEANRVRLWAVGANGGEWLDYKDKDLWLVEAQTDGWRYYYRPTVETYTFSFSP